MFEEMQSVQEYGEQRRQFRTEAHKFLRQRESLPEHDGERYVSGYGLAVGVRRGVGSGLPPGEGFVRAGMDGAFDLYVRDPFDLARELVDLDRDAGLVEKSGDVRFETAMVQGFDQEMDDSLLRSDDGILAWTQAMNARLA